MNKYQQSLIKEHSDLKIKLDNLESYIYSPAFEDENKAEFANKCIQLKGMRIYAESLEARLANVGIIYENGLYLHNVATINPPYVEGCFGSDYDADSERDEERDNIANN